MHRLTLIPVATAAVVAGLVVALESVDPRHSQGSDRDDAVHGSRRRERAGALSASHGREPSASNLPMSSFFAVARGCGDATMTVVSAQYMPGGSCELVDVCGAATTWSTVVEWADAWLEEWRGGTHGPASKFADEMTDGATDGVVAVLTVLAERAATSGPHELSWVGAGPLEDLLSHSGHDAEVLTEVERVARRHSAFRQALASVWLGSEVGSDVRLRLVALGACDLTAPKT